MSTSGSLGGLPFFCHATHNEASVNSTITRRMMFSLSQEGLSGRSWMVSRRHWLAGTAALAAAQSMNAAAGNIVIASSNGLRTCARAVEILKSGGDTLDAVIAGVNIVE